MAGTESSIALFVGENIPQVFLRGFGALVEQFLAAPTAVFRLLALG